MTDDILVKQDGPILRITLNAPDRGNAVTDDMVIRLTKMIGEAGKSSDIVVLRGAGKDFCVGRAGGDERFELVGSNAGKTQELIIERTIEVVFACRPRQHRPALVEHPGGNDVARERFTRTARIVFGEVFGEELWICVHG